MKKYLTIIGCAVLTQISTMKAQSPDFHRLFQEDQIRQLQADQQRMQDEIERMQRIRRVQDCREKQSMTQDLEAMARMLGVIE